MSDQDSDCSAHMKFQRRNYRHDMLKHEENYLFWVHVQHKGGLKNTKQSSLKLVLEVSSDYPDRLN